ncbi:AAA domain-containing protein [Streptomyces sp. NRRL B-24484]|uniref:AAA domain-containing protein n=1 Tax=Streptomyces sp. NRRL B-24484 TaxID=1463833 RepID=UPI0004C15926|nr:AAA domain-containing protein [Streptomyces sp. NRRL B-24484]
MSSSPPSTPDTDAPKVQQIFRYLAEAGESRVRPVRTLDHARQVLWLSDLPYEAPELQCFLASPTASADRGWLTVERPVHREMPPPGPGLTALLDTADPAVHEPEDPPRLRPPADGDPADPPREPLEAEYRSWLAEWTAWAEWRRRTRPLRNLYEALYRMHEDATALGESYELVLCFGYLTWSVEGEPIRRHLLAARAGLELDPGTGTLTLRPDPDAPGPELEEGMLDAGQKVRGDTREAIRQHLEEAGALTGPDDLDRLHRALEVWAIAAHPDGRYLRQEAQHRPVSLSEPRVSFAPAVVLRERSRRTGIEALHGIARAIAGGAEPTDLLRFVAGGETDGDTGPETAGTPAGRLDGGDPETYFALASNEEQRTIAERLRTSRLVVVQGPPGTGKTHTIANLVTDLLAHGQRVLITSHTARALKVLKDKLPPSIRELCVSRTDDGLVAQQELRGSVQAILERQGRYERSDYERRIADNEHRLRRARIAQATALTELRAVRERETYRHPEEIGDYRGTLQEIARRLAEEQARLGWLGPVPEPQPQLTGEQVRALRTAAGRFGPAERAAVADVRALPAADELPGAAAFEQAVLAVRSAEEGLAALHGNDLAARLDTAVSRLPAAAQHTAAAALEAFTAARTGIEATLPPWAGPLLQEAVTGQVWQLRGRHAATAQALAGVRTATAALGGSRVDGLDGYDVATAHGLVTALRDGLAAGEKLRGALGIRTRLRKAVGDFPEKARVDGAAADTPEAVARLAARIEVERHLQDVEREWGRAAPPWQALARRTAGLEAEAAALDALMALAARRSDLVAALAAVPELTVQPWQHADTCAALRDLLRARATLRAAEEPRIRLAAAESALVAWADRPDTAAAPVTALLAALRTGQVARYGALLTELAALREALALDHAFAAARTPVERVLPALAARLAEEPDDPRWETRLAAFEEAWAWSAWSARMRDLTDPGAEQKQRALLAEADGDIRIALERLAADRSWYGCLERLTDAEAVALASYQQSVARFGKGTGKYAHRYRRQAVESLRECQAAVPAWIMPLYQVTATVPMDRPGRFDVVIIDEASQSGPEAMLLAWLGRKIIVVGDDKQVSPANVGLDQDRLFQLQNRLLDGLPAVRRNLFSPMASFFDIATGLAGGRGRLMLQEHFRCMPEIIGFSNELSYHGRLQPLRQYGADRLPPVRTVYVPGATLLGTGQKQRNPEEAERLVAEVVRCCADPAYQGRSMGVITMLGSGQQHLIEDLLTERLPLEERQQRRIRVGDAEDFQGDERDVVFIGLVVSLAGEDGPRRPGPFSSEAMQQRLNVAASRARDQVWLFHSVAATDLGANDLRRRYLEYCTRPVEEQDGTGPDDVLPDVRHEAFDSLFEQRVYLALRGRRYRVRPQYPVGRYRIDLVVEGGTRRLAVECDGDAFHNEENADADAARQRELERVGWTFVRIRGSRFFLDPERALLPLWEELDRLGITPGPDAAAQTPADAVPDTDPAAAASASAVPAVRAAAVRAPAPEPATRPAAPAALPTAVPVAPTVAPPVPVPAPRRGEAGGRPSFPVTAVSVNSYRRAQRELNFLQDRLGAPDDAGPAVDAAALAARRAGREQARRRDEARRDFLRAYLDEVTPDPRLSGVGLVVPGSLVGVEHEGSPETVLYTVSAMPSAEAQQVSPGTDLARMLLWSEVGEHFAYTLGRDGQEQAVVRFIED